MRSPSAPYWPTRGTSCASARRRFRPARCASSPPTSTALRRAARLASEASERARRMLDEPFFARVDFAEAGEEAPQRIAIGPVQSGRRGRKLLVYDWRAPVCSPLLRFPARPGLLRLPVRRDFRHDDAQAPVPHGEGRAEVLRRHAPEHRRRDASGHPFRPGLRPYAPDRFDHSGRAERRRAQRGRARGVRRRRGRLRQDERRHAPRGVSDVPPARRARRGEGRNPLAGHGVFRIRVHGAAGIGRGEHPRAHAQGDRRGCARPRGRSAGAPARPPARRGRRIADAVGEEQVRPVVLPPARARGPALRALRAGRLPTSNSRGRRSRGPASCARCTPASCRRSRPRSA